MTTYAVKPGVNQALIDLVALTPQPATNGVEYTVRDPAIDGSVAEQGLFIELRWNTLGTAAKYVTLLTQFGLNSATTAVVTLYAPNEFYAMTRYNGLAVRPEKGRDIQREYLLKDVKIVVRDLVAVT